MNKYIKPDISFENLTLASNTGNECAVQNTSNIELECKQQIPGFPDGWTVFTTEKACYFQQDYPVCYHAPYEGQNVFSS